jgi:hypothetical protein
MARCADLDDRESWDMLTPIMMNRYTVLGTVGVTTGAILASWFGPRILIWWFTPPADIGINYQPVVTWAMKYLIWMQIGGIALGLIAGLWIGFATRKKSEG